MEQKKKSVTRGQHFLSQCWLKGFTPFGTKESQLVIFDFIRKKTFSTIPKNVAKERDFNQIEINGIDANYLESQLAIFEDKANAAICNIQQTGKFEGDDRRVILDLMALFALRNPFRREYWDNIRSHDAQIIFSIAAKNVGGTLNGIYIPPEFKEVGDAEIRVEMHKNEHIHLELSCIDTVIQCLVKRNWTLVHAEKDLTFIASDRPVILSWKDDKQYVADPGFASPRSQVVFPLTKKLALVGDFEERECVITASRRLMASINSLILSNTALQIYSETGDFIFLKHTGELAYGSEELWKYRGSLVAAE